MAVANWRYTILVILIGMGTFACIQTYYNSKTYKGPACSQIETYDLFVYSHEHLLNGKNLYIDHLDEHCFTYKYSPAFALFFGLFAYVPQGIGLWLWLMVTVGVTYAAMRALPGMDPPAISVFCICQL
ncbi:MAG: DUF2029 domain-containing protein [Bacteroidetes bacterium]|nr:DUF2029 domain-containing protein [Bacteroidota bacterium]